MGKWSKKIALSILVVIMVIGTLPGLFTVGEDRAYAADYIGEGEGTSNNPYLIATADQLDDVRNHPEASFKLIADIDLTDYLALKSWVPIGSDSNDRFSGNMNGNGYKIKKLRIDRPGPGSDYRGLFGVIDAGSVVTNMALENVNIVGDSIVGGLVGTNNGTISNSYTTGDVSGSSGVGVGGLVGVNNGTISNSYSIGSVSGILSVGGLVGINNSGTINSSYATGDVSGINAVGGLVGGSIGTINNSYATGDVSGNNNVGGLAGQNSIGTISTSYAIGNVNGNGDVGGLIGYNLGTIDKSYYNTGTSSQSDLNKGIGKETAEMISQDTYEDWVFPTIWRIDPLVNGGYPFLHASLSYNGNGYNTGNVPSSSYGLGVTASVYGNTGNLAKNGYSFVGWNRSADGNGRAYISGDPLTLVGDINLYAIWTVNTYEVSFNAEGGVAVTQTPMKQYDATYGKAADGTTSEPLPTTTRVGYTFGGWYTATGGMGTLVTNATNVSTAEDHTLYAKWLSPNALLRDLSVSSGVLNEPFAEGTADYTQRVANSIASLTVTPTVDDDTASVTVNGVSTASGQPSAVIALNVGLNTITIEVTAADNSVNTYTIIVTRAEAPYAQYSGGVIFDNKVTSTEGKLTLPAGWAGKVSLEDAITIDIPAGATDKELKLAIDRIVDIQQLLTNREVLASSIYEILTNPSGNLSKPVKLTFTFDPAKIKNNQRPAVFYYDEVKKVWVEVPGGKISGNSIAVEVDQFRKYTVIVVDQTTGMPVVDKTTDTVKAIQLSDIAGHWAEAAIRQAVRNSIVKGYTDFTFKPNHTVTRAEFVVMLMKALQPQEETAKLSFTDSAKVGSWAQQAVAQAVQAGFINGYEDGTFRPNANMTRAEMTTLIAKALKLSIESNATTGFTDDKSIPSWAKGAAAAMRKLGIMEGRGANQFNPDARAMRAEAITIVMRMLAVSNK